MDGHSEEPRMKRRRIDRDADEENNEGNSSNSNLGGGISSAQALRRGLNFKSSNRQDLRNSRFHGDISQCIFNNLQVSRSSKNFCSQSVLLNKICEDRSLKL